MDLLFYNRFDISVLVCQNGGEFLIQANTQKRQKVEDSTLFEHVEVSVIIYYWPACCNC